MILKLFPWILLAVVYKNLADEPIIRVDPGCPDAQSGVPTLILHADVPAHATAKCKNGNKMFVVASRDKVRHTLDGNFDANYVGDDCQFYKKRDANTFTVEVEVGWGEDDGQVIGMRRLFTMSCAYDDHGNGISMDRTVGDGFIAPRERQGLKGNASAATFQLKVIDILDEEIDTVDISIGRKVCLMAWDTSDSVTAFKAISCVAKNNYTEFSILRAGCGDGLVFPKTSGFKTMGKRVFSPYFEFFKLKNGSSIVFECKFTVCDAPCNGDSCTSALKRHRRLIDYRYENTTQDEANAEELKTGPIVVVTSPAHMLIDGDGIPVEHDNLPLVQARRTDFSNYPGDNREPCTESPAQITVTTELIAAVIIMAILLLVIVAISFYLCVSRNMDKSERI